MGKNTNKKRNDRNRRDADRDNKNYNFFTFRKRGELPVGTSAPADSPHAPKHRVWLIVGILLAVALLLSLFFFAGKGKVVGKAVETTIKCVKATDLSIPTEATANEKKTLSTNRQNVCQSQTGCSFDFKKTEVTTDDLCSGKTTVCPDVSLYSGASKINNNARKKACENTGCIFEDGGNNGPTNDKCSAPVPPPAEICTGSFSDDDGDGLSNCQDPDCTGKDNGYGMICELPEQSCYDDKDNDADTKADVSDDDCKGKRCSAEDASKVGVWSSYLTNTFKSCCAIDECVWNSACYASGQLIGYNSVCGNDNNWDYCGSGVSTADTLSDGNKFYCDGLNWQECTAATQSTVQGNYVCLNYQWVIQSSTTPTTTTTAACTNAFNYDLINAELCSGDDQGLTGPTNINLIGGNCVAGNPVKCEYKCKAGFQKSGSACVAAYAAGCIGGFPSTSTLCSGDNQQIPVGQETYSLVDSCTEGVKCERTCNAGYVRSGSTCVAAPTTAVDSDNDGVTDNLEPAVCVGRGTAGTVGSNGCPHGDVVNANLLSQPDGCVDEWDFAVVSDNLNFDCPADGSAQSGLAGDTNNDGCANAVDFAFIAENLDFDCVPS